MLLKDIINVKICCDYGWKVLNLEIGHISPLLVYKCNAIQIKYLIAIYMELDKLNLKFI